MYAFLIRWYSTYAHKVVILLIVYNQAESKAFQKKKKFSEVKPKDKKLNATEHLFSTIYYATW